MLKKFGVGLFAFAALLATVGSTRAMSDDHGTEGYAYVDRGFKNAERPINDQMGWDLPEWLELFKDIKLAKSNTAATLKKQTPIRSQGARGTCSIFSAMAMLESMMVITGKAGTELDLSEEWLDYLAVRTQDDDGSTSTRNFSLIAKQGMVEESVWPYLGETWSSLDYSELSRERCGKLEGTPQEVSCRFAHRDPRLLLATEEELLDPSSELFDAEFATIRSEAKKFKESYLNSLSGMTSFRVSKVSAVKALLDQGIPVTLDLDFYYGAWNHGRASTLGIGRNMDHLAKGIVGYPELDSMDYAQTQKDPAGHSILVIGYDDSVEVETDYLAEDGVTRKQAVYKGVYYFKNSWGSHSFGSSAVIDGVNAPGYGMITQKYAHDYGGFYRLPLK